MKIRKIRQGDQPCALVEHNGATRLVPIGGIENDEAAILQRFESPIVEPIARAMAAAPHVQKRREKMIQIGEQSVASRNRVFKNLPHVPASRKNQAYDGLIALILRNRIKMEDKIIVRHLKSGEYEEVTVANILDELGDMYLLQLELRKRDQSYRDQVNRIFNSKMSDKEKAEAIEKIELPEFLDVDESSTTKLVARNNGRT